MQRFQGRFNSISKAGDRGTVCTLVSEQPDPARPVTLNSTINTLLYQRSGYSSKCHMKINSVLEAWSALRIHACLLTNMG